jgi:hypothetical protein
LDARSRARHTGVTRVDANTVADIWLLPPPPVGMGAGAAGNVSWFREENPILSPDDIWNTFARMKSSWECRNYG